MTQPAFTLDMAPAAPPTRYDVAVVGAGFAGLYMLHLLRSRGFSACVFEAGSGVGGTWFWNRYPGARCDVNSLEYSYSFSEELQQEWKWSERFATQPEILAYINHVADRFDLRRDIQFDTRVMAMDFDAASGLWTVRTDRGTAVEARFCVMASGCLSASRAPAIPGMESFEGQVYHTGQWPHEPVDFSGQRVALIGTGSSGIQATPVVAQVAADLVVFQRTPNFSIPARNQPTDPEHEREWKANYAEYRRRARDTTSGILYDYNDRPAATAPEEELRQTYQDRWQKGGVNFMRAFSDLIFDRVANDTAANFVRSQIRALVRDPETAARLTPFDHPIGTKRICIDSGYYETFNRENVRLVDIRTTPIEAITPTGLRTSAETFTFDSIILATGFDAMTGALSRIAITGRDGQRLTDKWADGPRTYLGLMVAGFPNMFTVTGPGSPSTLSNMVVTIEQHVEWIGDCVSFLRERGLATIEAEREAEDAWVAHVNEVADRTLYPLANSWYMGANIPGKPRVFMPYVGGFATYRQKCIAVAEDNYAGFRLAAQQAGGAQVMAAAAVS